MGDGTWSQIVESTRTRELLLASTLPSTYITTISTPMLMRYLALAAVKKLLPQANSSLSVPTLQRKNGEESLLDYNELYSELSSYLNKLHSFSLLLLIRMLHGVLGFW